MIQKLRRRVERNCISKDGNTNTLAYWSEVIFAKSVFILAPLSLLAIIPAIIIYLKSESYLILWFDIFCFCVLIFVGYVPNVPVKIRKTILMCLIFMTSFILLIELGSFGPGLVYLLAATVYFLLLFPGNKTKTPLISIVVFCIIYGFFIYFDLVNAHSTQNINLMEWIAISSNVVFLSAILTLMVSFFLSKLESALKEKLHLLESVRKTNTELNKSIAEVNSKNKELEQFAYIASHDLQEPLRMVSSFMDLLKRKYEDKLDEKALRYINFATDGAKRMKQIILDLLEYSRAGRINSSPVKINLNRILEDYQILRKRIISEKQVELKTDNLPTMQSYNAPLTQTFHSILDNAIKYSKNVKPQISISSIEKNDHWQISVEDNGIGIDSKFFEKIFIIFQRLHNKKEYSGSGIGLSVAKKHIESWGGKIWVESEIGKGSTFYFTIPKK